MHTLHLPYCQCLGEAWSTQHANTTRNYMLPLNLLLTNTFGDVSDDKTKYNITESNKLEQVVYDHVVQLETLRL